MERSPLNAELGDDLPRIQVVAGVSAGEQSAHDVGAFGGDVLFHPRLVFQTHTVVVGQCAPVVDEGLLV